jgi:hypothetical protein
VYVIICIDILNFLTGLEACASVAVSYYFFEDFRNSEVLGSVLYRSLYDDLAQLANASSVGLRRMHGRSTVRSLTRAFYYFARGHLFFDILI